MIVKPRVHSIHFATEHDKVNIELLYSEAASKSMGVNVLISITKKAQEIIKDMQENMEEETYLRFGVTSSCCNQMNYSLSLAHYKKEQEEELILHGIKILVHPSDARFTDQTEIDFLDDGFIINNPNPLVSPLQ